MKRAICFLTAFFIIVSLLPLSLSASPVDTIIENLSDFNEHFSITTDDFNGTLRDAVIKKPQLNCYIKSMSYKAFGNRYDCSVTYFNTDIPMNSIWVTGSDEELYQSVRSSLMNTASTVFIVYTGDTSRKVDFPDIIDQVHDLDYIAFMGYSSVYMEYSLSQITDAAVYKLKFTYDYDSATLIKMKKETQDEVNRLATEVFKPDMSQYDLVRSIHDYLIDNTVYHESESDSDHYVFYAYGPLIKGVGVCEGYAEAARLLFNAVGIECIHVEGTAGDDHVGHAWNMVNIGGNWYQLDITWDDPISPDGKNYKTYDYFNITDSEMARDHVWSGDYPKCTATDRGINATQTAERPQSQTESSKPNVVSVIQSGQKRSSSKTVSPKPSVPSSSQVSETSSVPLTAAGTSEIASTPVLPVFSVAPSPTSSELSGFQLSQYISAVSHELGISVQLVTILLIVLISAVVLIIISLFFRRRV